MIWHKLTNSSIVDNNEILDAKLEKVTELLNTANTGLNVKHFCCWKRNISGDLVNNSAASALATQGAISSYGIACVR